MLLRKESNKKSHKIEFFNAELWGYKRGSREILPRYRLRVNGKWYKAQKFHHMSFLSKWEARDIIWRSIL
jgi:hypothetical protein